VLGDDDTVRDDARLLGSVALARGTLWMTDLLAMDQVTELRAAADQCRDPVATVQDAESNAVYCSGLDGSIARVYGVGPGATYRPWDEIHIRLGDDEVARTQLVGELFVDSATLVIADYAALDHWSADALDGQADVVCWGSHADKMARKLDLARRGQQLGWFDVPVADAPDHVRRLEAHKRFWYGLNHEVRPHSHRFRLEHALVGDVNAVAQRVGPHDVLGVRLHQDGIWPVLAGMTADGRARDLRVQLA